MQRYELTFQREAADTSWSFMRFEFIRVDGTLYAAGRFFANTMSPGKDFGYGSLHV